MEMEKAIEGFTLYLKASNFSPSTISLYTIVLKNLCGYLNNPEVSKISSQDLQRYMIYLQEEYVPKRFGDNQKPLSGSSRQNHWKAMRTFFKWATEELKLKKRPDDRLKLPQNNPKAVLPFTEQDIHAILKSAEYTSEARPGNRRAFKMQRRTFKRDVALLLLLLDTGLRVGEASRLNIMDVNMETGEVYVAPFGDSTRKTKSRVVYLGKNSKNALWHYIASRKESEKEEPLFMSEKKRRLDGNAIRCLLADLGERASVPNCHPHRFRHTFAIQFLRGGGDVFSLQRLLGHSSLSMVAHYLSLANTDSANAHRKASPVDKWL